MKTIEKVSMLYQCEYCNDCFNNKADCEEHEKTCEYKDSKNIKVITCSFSPMYGSFFHGVKINKMHKSHYNNANWYYNNDEGECLTIHEFDKIIDEGRRTMPQYCFEYKLYTFNLSESYEKEIFEKMHELINKSINKIIVNCELINSDNFKQFKTSYHDNTGKLIVEETERN